MKHRLMHFDCVDSTNRLLKELAENGAEDGLIVYADEQTAGRGRLGRKWQSKRGENALFSVLVRRNIEGLVFRAALAAVNTLKRLTGDAYLIKWPNDIVINGKKIAGILCEAALKDGCAEWTVAGIGVNLNASEFPDDLPWAESVKRVSGREIPPVDFIEAFSAELDTVLEMQFSDVLAEITKSSATVGSLVTAGEITGRALRMDADGSLIIADSDEIEYRIVVGDVSVRGVMGYV